MAEFCIELLILKYKMTNSLSIFLGQFVDGEKQRENMFLERQRRNGETYPLASNWSRAKIILSEWG